jgi:cysteine desulfurase
MNNVYFDFAATTPIDSEVLESMLPFFSENFGNPSSIHRYGQRAEAAVEEARSCIAGLLVCDPSQITFTSGGSEANNLALKGTALFRRREMGANRVLISPVEHDAILKTAKQLRDIFNFQLEYIPVDSEGKIILDEFQKMAGYDVAIVSAFHFTLMLYRYWVILI